MKKQFDFVGKRVILFIIPIVLIAAGIVSFFVQGFNLGQDFTGGTSATYVLRNKENHDEKIAITDSIEKELIDLYEANGVSGAKAAANSEEGSITVKTSELSTETQLHVKEAVAEVYYIDESEYQYENISGNVSKDLKEKAIIGVVIAVILMLVYITIRFDWRSGIAAVVSLAHDVLIMLTAYTILQIPMDSNMIAAILTILGYSINATIIVFDRVRENNRLYGKNSFAENANDGINKTFTRSLNTTLTTLFTIGMIFVLGPSSIKAFSLPIIVGIIAGLYSSVCLSSNLWILLKGKKAFVKK